MTISKQDATYTPEPDPPAEDKSEKRSGISPIQVAASGLAAATSTAALSYFGVLGTILGAALGSAITIVGNDIYSRSIRRTAERVSKIAPIVVTARATVPIRPTGTDVRQAASLPAQTTPEPDQAREERDFPADAQADGDARTAEASGDAFLTRLMGKYGRAKVLIASGIAVFVTILLAVLALELFTGKPLADTVRGRDGSGTTLFEFTRFPSGESEELEEVPSRDERPPRQPGDNQAPREDRDDDTPPEPVPEAPEGNDREVPFESDDDTEPTEPDEQARPEPDEESRPGPEEFDEPPAEPEPDDDGSGHDVEAPADDA